MQFDMASMSGILILCTLFVISKSGIPLTYLTHSGRTNIGHTGPVPSDEIKVKPYQPRTHFTGTEQLLEDKLFNYNKNVRPCDNTTEKTRVNFSASLIRIIDLDEKSQRLVTNLWLKIQWRDPRLVWDPVKYGSVYKINVPADLLCADGSAEITIMVDCIVYCDGTIEWKPPAIYQSVCAINVALFPYDIQYCDMKFGDWTYSGDFVDLRQDPEGEEIGKDEHGQAIYFREDGMDLSYYQPSSEWDILNLTSKRNNLIYRTCCGSYFYPDVTFNFTVRRKPEFYTAFLVAPSVLIASLTTFVSFLPSRSMKKMTFAISILISLMVFYTALVDLVPPNSIVTPLLMKYLLFTNVLVCLSIGVNVIALNLHYRTVHTHEMSPFMRWFFLKAAPRVLYMKVPEWHQIDPKVDEIKKKIRNSVAFSARLCGSIDRRPSPFLSNSINRNGQLSSMATKLGMHPIVVKKMITNVNAIAELFSSIEDANQIKEDWGYVALVLDRITFWIFLLSNVTGTIMIVKEAVNAFFGAAELPIPEKPEYPLGGDTYLWNLLHKTNTTIPDWLWNHNYDNCYSEKCTNYLISGSMQCTDSGCFFSLLVILAAVVSGLL